MGNYFYVPIFFICLRESVEAAIIVAVLLSLVEQLMLSGAITGTGKTEPFDELHNEKEQLRIKRILRRMRIQIWAGTLAGLVVALAVGGAFIAVFYTTLNDIWSQTEDLWEGIFSLIASGLIFVMGLSFLTINSARLKWRIKLSEAFDNQSKKALKAEGLAREAGELDAEEEERIVLTEEERKDARKKARSGKWALFLLPFITVVREGLEAVVFIGGVSLNVDAVSIPIAVIVGLFCGGLIGYLIYRGGNAVALHWFLIVSTGFLFLIGAGLFSKGIGFLQLHKFVTAVGSDVAEAGDGTGSFQVAGNVWHLTYGNPEVGSATTNGGWQVFNAILGWNNTATVGSITGYCAYWIAVIIALVHLKWKEGRVTYLGRGSAAYWRIKALSDARHAEKEHESSEEALSSPSLSEHDKKVTDAPVASLSKDATMARQQSEMSIKGY